MKKQYIRTKSVVIISLAILLFACLIGLVACSDKDDSYTMYTANYSTDGNGSIIGEAAQRIDWRRIATEVTAVPNEGYLFAGWSDDTYPATRQDKDIRADIEVCAFFVSKIKTLKYEYNGATSNNSATEIKLDYDNLTDLSFAIPAKANYEFQGWYLDKELTRRVTDKDGVYYLGKSIFYSDSDTLYARWETREGLVYPVLMLFIGDIDARFKYINDFSNNEYIYSLKHELAIHEIKISEKLAPVLSSTLNEWFEGKVYFEFDTFFTVSTIGLDSFYNRGSEPPSTNIGTWGNIRVEAPCVPEVAPILKNYRSVLTTYYDVAVNELSGIGSTMYDHAGNGSNKYAELFMSQQYYYGFEYDASNPLNEFLESATYWEGIKGAYYHEFVHTIEQGIGLDDYHDFGVYYSQDHHEMGDELLATKLYLLNEAEMNGTLTGIPFAYWEGKLPVRYYYWSQRYVDGIGKIKIIDDEDIEKIGKNVTGTLPYGSSFTVEAIPNEGYKFVGWSDGVTTARRTDENIISLLEVYALFEEI